MQPIAQDLWRGVRSFARTPSVALLAVLALALGSGASTAIFSVVDAALWKPLPFREPGNLVTVWEKNPALDRFQMFVAPANIPAWRQNHCFEDMAAVTSLRINLTGGPNGHIEPEELRAERVSANLFPLLGVQPAIGRAFTPDEDRPGHADFALLSHSLWQRRFAADRGIVGQTVRLREQPYRVVGVLPPGFSVLDPRVDIWLPLALDPYDPRAARARTLIVVARLKPGVSLERARAEMEGIGARQEQANPELNSGWRPSLFGFRDELVGGSRKALEVILAAVGLLILMACANVANLLLVRGASREKELALRVALGASRARVAMLLLAESTLLSLAGGAVGLVFAWVLLAFLSRLGASSIPRIAEASFDARMFLFAVGVSLLSGLLFGIVPALRGSGESLRAALATEGRGGTAGRGGRLVRNALVVVEVALAVVVLIAAGLLLGSFVRLRAANPGFQAGSVLTFRLPLGGGRNTAPDRRAPFLDRVTASLAALPGAREIGAVDSLPLTGLGVGSSFSLEGNPEPPPERRPLALMRSVTTGYFHALGIPLVAGRGFADSDTAQSPPVAIVDRSMVRRFSANGSPLGRHLTLDQASHRVAEIVGVVGEVKPESMNGEDWPTVYLPYTQRPLTAMTFAVRAARPPLSLAVAAERAIHNLDPDQPVADVKALDQVVGDALAEARFDTILLAGFAEIAFLLCAVGIYGVISYDTTQRTREIGVRMALGAQPGDVLRLILRQGAWLAGCGIALGLVAAFALTRLMASMLYGVQPSDFPTFAAMAALLGAVALLASYLPSRRAMALDPVAALHHE